MTKKIKTGRFDGQPEWLPDCKMVAQIKSEEDLLFLAELPERILIYDKGGSLCYESEIFDADYFEYIYEPDLQPLDVVVYWDDGDKSVNVIIWKHLDCNWDHILLVPQDLYHEDSEDPKVWKEHIKAGRVEVIK